MPWTKAYIVQSVKIIITPIIKAENGVTRAFTRYFVLSFFFFVVVCVHSLSNYILCRVTTPVQTISSEIWHCAHKRRTNHTGVQYRSYVPYAYIGSFCDLFDGQWMFLKLDSAKLTCRPPPSNPKFDKTILENLTKDTPIKFIFTYISTRLPHG